MRLEAAQRFMSHLIAGRSLLPALLVAIASVACGQATADPQATTPVSVTITVPPATSQALPPSSGSNKSFAPIPSLLALVDSVSLSVIDADNHPLIDATTVPISAGQTVPVTIEVLTGPARTFVGRAMDEQGRVLFQGRSSPVNLRGDPVSVGIAMTLNPFPLDLNVAKSGSGNGTVTSNSTGIDCGATCSAPFTLGTDVTLTAAPDANSMFTGWSGAGCTGTGTGTCTVTIDAVKTVTATFTRIQYVLDVTKTGTGGGTVTSSPAGIDCGATCSAPFDAASNVTLTAMPDATSTFAGWTGAACTGTGTCVVPMTAAQPVTATFTRIQYALDVTPIGTGGGTVTSSPAGIACGKTCAAPFDAGSSVTLTANPDATSTFAGWTGAGCAGTGPCVVPMTAAQAITATFTRIQYRLDVTKTGSGGGTVSSAPSGIDCGTTCAAAFDAASSVTLTAKPDATSTFAGWDGACTGTGPCIVPMTAAQAITATFTRIQYRLDVTPKGSGGGIVTSFPAGIACGKTCTAMFDAGSSVTLTAVPDGTSIFSGWAGAACTGTGTCVVPMTAAQAVTATFTRIQYALTVTPKGTGGGTVTSSPPGIACGVTCAVSFDATTSITLTAAPDATSTFAGWAGAGCAGTGPCVVTIDAAQAVTATFTRIQYVLDVTKTGTGG
ncbi:MAG: hypothetical protein HY207_11280, partial [Nitrospirae bacterium]|nr:hypothetical protein [Nitrospirota bacterium]